MQVYALNHESGKEGEKRDTKKRLAGRRANNEVMVWSTHARTDHEDFGLHFPKAENLALKIMGNSLLGLFFFFGGTGCVFIKPLIPVYISWMVVILVDQLTLFFILVIIQKEIHEKVAVHLWITNLVKLYPEWGLSFCSLCSVYFLNSIDSDANCAFWSQLTYLGRKKKTSKHMWH